jgi:hypothetical protein
VADDPHTTERTRRVAAEPDDGHPTDTSIRAAFLERAVEAVGRIVDTVDERSLQAALDADTDVAVLLALGLTRNGAPSRYATATDPLAAARARGEQAKRDLLAVQGDLLDAREVATD